MLMPETTPTTKPRLPELPTVILCPDLSGLRRGAGEEGDEGRRERGDDDEQMSARMRHAAAAKRERGRERR